jgi:dienelactone hydrolase
VSATLVARLLSLTVAALLAACGTEETTVANSSTGISASQVSANNANLELDLSCDTATYPSAALLQCELGNVARTLEANIEQLMPAFVSRELQQSATNIQAVLQRSAQDPSWNLPPAFGNTGLTPLCAGGAGPCVGDPFRYPGVNGPDGDIFYTQQAEVLPVVYYDQGCARISGQVWKPRNTGNRKLPAVIIKNGSVQANEALYWWAAQELVRAGYMVLTNDPRGQGLSDFATPTGEQGGNINGAVFFEGLVNDIDFLMSSPSKPYPHELSCKGTYPTVTQAFNPFHQQLDETRIGAAGHSYGAAGVTWVQSYGAEDSEPWPGLLSKTNPLKAIVAWDALGSRNTPASATLTSLLSTQTVTGTLPVGTLINPEGAPPVSPRVPALGFTSEYGFTPAPFVRNTPREEHLAGFKDWVAAGVPVYNITIAGSTHLDYSPGPALPASSWCPKTDNNACEGGWAKPMITHYTLAWFDRFLKKPGEQGYDDADLRLLDDAQWAERMSFHFASARRFKTRDGQLFFSEDIRMQYPKKSSTL